jgi:ketosteroid isomerase-like protein
MKIANGKLILRSTHLILLATVLVFLGCSNLSRNPSASAEKETTPQQTATNAAMPNPALPAPRASSEIDLESERNALLETDQAFSRTSEEKGAAQAFYDFFAADGVSLSAGEPPIRGRDAIKIHLSAGPQGFLTWQPTAADVAKSGDMGFTWGTSVFQGKGPDEKPQIKHSKYVTVWKKQSSGRWKVVLFSTSPSPPPAERRQGE